MIVWVPFCIRYRGIKGWKVKEMKHFTSIGIIISIILTGNSIGNIEDSAAGKSMDVKGDSLPEEVAIDLKDIKERKVLKAITSYSETNYFLYKGRPMGYEYELLERLADQLDVNLDILIAKDQQDAYELLRRGEGDIVAMGLTINANNKEHASFSLPHRTTRQVLVQKMPWNWHSMKRHEIEKLLVSDPFELIGKPVFVRENSAHYQRLKNLEEEIGEKLNIVEIPGYMTAYEIMSKVNSGEYDYAVIDENQAKINQSDFPDLDVGTPVSLPIRTGWALRKSSPELLEAVNQWIEKMHDEVDYYVIYNKYFKNRRFFKNRIGSKFFSRNSGEISPYDTLVKKYSRGYDWRFISSVIYQESHFVPDTSSWAGAVGLMQLMPTTAKAFGVKNPRDPEESISAGVDYIHYLMNFWKEVPDSVQRLKFALASYNCGMAHVLDAQRLAEKYGYDKDQWDENVEIFVRKLSKPEYFTDPVVKYGYCRGEEPYQYVRQIIDRYSHYKKFIPSKEEKSLMASVKFYDPEKVF